MDLVFILTNFNNTSFTAGAVTSILNSDAKEAQIIVVDNASAESDVNNLRMLEKKIMNLKVLYNHENVGYFRGLNIGINYARKYFKEVQLLVVGNNDLIFSENFYSSILLCRNKIEKYPVVSPNIVTVDGISQNPHVITKISKVREFIYDLYHLNYYLAGVIKYISKITHNFTDRDDELQHEIAQEIYQGYGACYILTRKFFDNFNDLWSPTFLMYEEFFLSKQLEGKGFKTYYEPSIMVQHCWHAAMDKLPGRYRWELSRDAHREYRKFVKVWR